MSSKTALRQRRSQRHGELAEIFASLSIDAIFPHAHSRPQHSTELICEFMQSTSVTVPVKTNIYVYILVLIGLQLGKVFVHFV